MTSGIEPMTGDKQLATKIVEHLFDKGQLEFTQLCAISEAINSIDTLRDRDNALERLWAEIRDVPMNPKTECMEEPVLGFPAGTHREEIWHWFDRRHSKGVAYLLYGDGSGITRTPEVANLLYLKQLCIECESSTCQFNHGGECRFALVHERKPRITDEEGCIDFDYQEGEC